MKRKASLSELYKKIPVDSIYTPARRRWSSLMLAPRPSEERDRGRNIFAPNFPDSSASEFSSGFESASDLLLGMVSVWMSGEARSF
jgi:hypothetical protein